MYFILLLSMVVIGIVTYRSGKRATFNGLAPFVDVKWRNHPYLWDEDIPLATRNKYVRNVMNPSLQLEMGKHRDTMKKYKAL